VLYYSIKHTGQYHIDWGWIAKQETVFETPYVRHARTRSPLCCAVDGRTGRGVIRKGAA
jgi:hypothetical protein